MSPFYTLLYLVCMNPLEILQNVKKLVFADVAAPVSPAVAPVVPETVELAKEYSLQDGTVVKISELVVGGTVTNQDGTPHAEGAHTLADGTSFTCDAGGVITEIAPVAAPAPAMPEDMSSKFEQRFAAIETKFSALETENGNLKAAFAKADEAIKGLIMLVENLVKEPDTNPAQPVNTGFRYQAAESKKDKLERMFDLFKTEAK